MCSGTPPARSAIWLSMSRRSFRSPAIAAATCRDAARSSGPRAMWATTPSLRSILDGDLLVRRSSPLARCSGSSSSSWRVEGSAASTSSTRSTGLAVPQSSHSAATTARADGSAAAANRSGSTGRNGCNGVTLRRGSQNSSTTDQLSSSPARNVSATADLPMPVGPVMTTGHNRVVASSAMATSSVRASSRSTKPARRAGRPTRSAAGDPMTSAADRPSTGSRGANSTSPRTPSAVAAPTSTSPSAAALRRRVAARRGSPAIVLSSSVPSWLRPSTTTTPVSMPMRMAIRPSAPAARSRTANAARTARSIERSVEGYPKHAESPPPMSPRMTPPRSTMRDRAAWRTGAARASSSSGSTG